MSRLPFARDGLVMVHLPTSTAREILWRVGHALATYTDETAISLLGLSEADEDAHEGWATRAESVTAANEVLTAMAPEKARETAAALIRAADLAEIGTNTATPATFRLCGRCKTLRPDTRWYSTGTICADCYQLEMRLV